MPFSCLCVHSTHRIRDRFLTCRCATLIALLNNLLFFACNKKQNELKLFYTQSTFSIALCCGLLFVSFLLERRASTQIEQVRSVFFFVLFGQKMKNRLSAEIEQNMLKRLDFLALFAAYET